jgi:hypothetical protein
LLISGVLDPATPPEMAQQAAHDLANSRLIAIKEGTHGTGSPCINRLVSEFVEQGAAAGLDASCADQIHLPPFATKTATGRVQQKTILVLASRTPSVPESPLLAGPGIGDGLSDQLGVQQQAIILVIGIIGPEAISLCFFFGPTRTHALTQSWLRLRTTIQARTVRGLYAPLTSSCAEASYMSSPGAQTAPRT